WYPGIHGVVAAADERGAAAVRQRGVPERVRVVAGQTEAVLGWADMVLCVSGTVTLHVARHLRPMVVIFRGSRAVWLGIGWWLINTRTFTLPNLIAGGG